MPAINASASSHFTVDNKWLEEFADESKGNHYCDIYEIAERGEESTYIVDLVDRDWETR